VLCLTCAITVSLSKNENCDPSFSKKMFTRWKSWGGRREICPTFASNITGGDSSGADSKEEGENVVTVYGGNDECPALGMGSGVDCPAFISIIVDGDGASTVASGKVEVVALYGRDEE
jgi:hypothetical protein